eukprot:TRINITY_DN3307_c0_g1_i1.p1 TRINITY_DN3307_c0_g1~~TRINITY_DN3307_c0_g1_i1.p1  ORF type:complete len:585 (-),score=152.40 TRINITY_DN3307_c0_g1_i1:105-1859(-)
MNHLLMNNVLLSDQISYSKDLFIISKIIDPLKRNIECFIVSNENNNIETSFNIINDFPIIGLDSLYLNDNELLLASLGSSNIKIDRIIDNERTILSNFDFVFSLNNKIPLDIKFDNNKTSLLLINDEGFLSIDTNSQEIEYIFDIDKQINFCVQKTNNLNLFLSNIENGLNILDKRTNKLVSQYPWYDIENISLVHDNIFVTYERINLYDHQFVYRDIRRCDETVSKVFDISKVSEFKRNEINISKDMSIWKSNKTHSKYHLFTKPNVISNQCICLPKFPGNGLIFEDSVLLSPLDTFVIPFGRSGNVFRSISNYTHEIIPLVELDREKIISSIDETGRQPKSTIMRRKKSFNGSSKVNKGKKPFDVKLVEYLLIPRSYSQIQSFFVLPKSNVKENIKEIRDLCEQFEHKLHQWYVCGDSPDRILQKSKSNFVEERIILSCIQPSPFMFEGKVKKKVNKVYEDKLHIKPLNRSHQSNLLDEKEVKRRNKLLSMATDRWKNLTNSVDIAVNCNIDLPAQKVIQAKLLKKNLNRKQQKLFDSNSIGDWEVLPDTHPLFDSNTEIIDQFMVGFTKRKGGDAFSVDLL